MVLFEDKKDCCGCTACASICSTKAIAMQPDALGFLYPQVDQDTCIECGLCEKVCAFQNEFDHRLNLQDPLAYAVRHKDMQEVETSRSGAMFIAISDYFLENGGVIYGVGYEDGFRVCHKKAETKEQRNEFKGSKYVQSDLRKIFSQVKKDLKEGLKVVFSGTPCQTAGLMSFLGKSYRSNLFLVDIVCHGVPSPYIWRDYLSYIETRYKQKIISVNFRDKSLGWADHKESFIFSNSKKIIRETFTHLFFKHVMIRPSCGNCKYANINRPSDITIADFWGWEKTDKNFNSDDKGCSLVFLNTEKGLFVWEEIKNQINYISAKLKNCLQPNLISPTDLDPKSQSFYRDYEEKGFLYIAKHYGDFGWKIRLKTLIRRLLSIIKRINK